MAKQDLGRDVGKLEGSVVILTRFAFAIVALLGLLVAGGFFILSQLNEVKVDVAVVKNDIHALSVKLAKLDHNIGEIRQAQMSAASVLGRVDDRLAALGKQRLPHLPTIQITADEATFIRSYIAKYTGMKILISGTYEVGDTIPADRLRDFPKEIEAKIPKLARTKFTIDEKRSILIVSAEDRRVLAILPQA